MFLRLSSHFKQFILQTFWLHLHKMHPSFLSIPGCMHGVILDGLCRGHSDTDTAR